MVKFDTFFDYFDTLIHSSYHFLVMVFYFFLSFPICRLLVDSNPCLYFIHKILPAFIDY
jgi:hypothetical protein